MESFTFLSSGKITLDTLFILNEFEREFGNATINRRGDWRSRILHEYALVNDVARRDVLFANKKNAHAGLQEYCVIDDFAYAEGLYVRPTYRGNGIGHSLRETLFSYLRTQHIEIFYIGKKGLGFAHTICRTVGAQGVARSDIEKLDCVDIERRRDGSIKSYGIKL